MSKGKISFLLVVLLLVTAFLPTAVLAETTEETWIKVAPRSEDVSISVKSDGAGEFAAIVKIMFGSSGYRVNYDDVVTIAEGTKKISFVGEADIQAWTGGSPTVMTEKTLTYHLGKLSKGDYSFTFKSSDFSKTYEFEVLPDVYICYGDINDDGKINSTDYTLIRRCILERRYDERADINVDGVVNSTDLTVFKRYLLKMINTLPYRKSSEYIIF
ncbi:MAG TPA: hypothetical protein GXX73_06180 [Clostridium sp.]|nr:hypothetical protein [Clostridium sp.]